MNIGIRLHDACPGTLQQRAQAAHAQGFGCVQLALGKALGEPYAQPAAMTAGLAAEVMRALSPLKVAVLGCYLNLAHPDETVYRDTLARYRAHLRFSRWLGDCVVGTETCNPNPAGQYDPAVTHSDAALESFLRRLEPVVKDAEQLGATLAVEPVYTHIVSTPARARRVLDTFRSPNLKIILDPVNLLHPDNLPRTDEVLDEAADLLLRDTAVMHIKDYRVVGSALQAVAAGQGQMAYARFLRRVAAEKPSLCVTLENTAPDNAEAARLFVQAELRKAQADVAKGL